MNIRLNPYEERFAGNELPNPFELERREHPISPNPKPQGPLDDGSGPKQPDSDSTQKDNLLKRMRKG